MIYVYAGLGGYLGINGSMNFLSITKRGIVGSYHSVSEAHLHRDLAESDFRYNKDFGLGVEDAEWAQRALRGILGEAKASPLGNSMQELSELEAEADKLKKKIAA